MKFARALGDAVALTKYMPATDLPLLYNAAAMVCYPLLFEGFGLPVLEAMACGIPVIASNATALPQVIGDAAYLVEPNDVEALAQALYHVASAARADLRARGLMRARAASWTRLAKQTIEIYARAFTARAAISVQDCLT